MAHYLNLKQFKMADNDFYVQIKDPTELRRLLLECSKQILQSLQDYETLLSIREEKIKQIIELRRTIKEIYSLNTELNRVFPKAQLRASKKEKKIAPSHAKRKEELSSFQSELDAIEEKLKGLGA